MNYPVIALPIPVFKNFSYISEDKIEIGCRVRVPFGKKSKTGYVVDNSSIPPDTKYGLKPVEEVIDRNTLVTQDLMELAYQMSEHYVASIGEIMPVILPVSLKYPKRPVRCESDHTINDSTYILLPEQKKALQALRCSAEKNEFEQFLLYGVTDSGKTEVYMNFISSVLELRKQVILLVPEIAITSQLKFIFTKRFSRNRIALWHSRMTPVKKMDYISRIKKGSIDIIIGPRSAVFAPFNDLGAIIIDEEQDPSYKNNSSPYYDARWVAQRRCEINNAVLLKVSATPGIETLYDVRRGSYRCLTINEKVHKSNNPVFAVVDMKAEKSRMGRGVIFSKYMLDSVRDVLAKKKQCIILHNRRGFSSSVICRECGRVMSCPNCNTALIYHINKKELLCHMCSYRERMYEECPYCMQGGLIFRGFGTERIENALKKIFSDARIIRMDVDSTVKTGSADRIFRDFADGKYDIMIGTQIIAKGWDFPNVDLVGITNSDIGMSMPDFRSSERTYALLKQAAGRTGRSSGVGKIVVQTYNPQHYVIKLLFDRDYNNFYEKEIATRQKSAFPPFSRLTNIVSADKNEKTARKNIDYCKNFIENNNKQKGISLIGPAPAPIYRLRGLFRWHILVKYEDNKDRDVKKLIKMMLEEKKFIGRLKVDVDPQELM
ncbi:primosomal protein N', partial [Elusimicrobiota bacterium]